MVAVASKPTTSPLTGDLIAMGIVRMDSNGVLTDMKGNAISQAATKENEAFTPTTGSTVQMIDSNLDGLEAVTPAGTLAALTVNLPSDANSVVGQQRKVYFSQAITALSWAQKGGGGTRTGAPASAAAGSMYYATKVAAGTWVFK